VPEGAL